MKLTALCLVDDDGEVVREAVVCTESKALAAYLCGTGLACARLGLEAGPDAGDGRVWRPRIRAPTD